MRVVRMGKDVRMAQTFSERVPWTAQPDEQSLCPWFGGHLADDMLFVSDSNQCPNSRVHVCPRASVGMRPESAACAYGNPALRARILICATHEVVSADEWRTRMAERM